MRLCRLTGNRYGMISDSKILDVTRIVESYVDHTVTGDSVYTSLPAIADAVARTSKDLSVIGDIHEAPFLSPVARPTTLVAAPVNYEAHIVEAEADPAITFNKAVLRIEKAGLFLKSVSSLVGPSEGVTLRFPDRRTDHELELCLVMNAVCKCVSEAASRQINGPAC